MLQKEWKVRQGSFFAANCWVPGGCPMLVAPEKRLPHSFAFFAKGWDAMLPGAPVLIRAVNRGAIFTFLRVLGVLGGKSSPLSLSPRICLNQIKRNLDRLLVFLQSWSTYTPIFFRK